MLKIEHLSQIVTNSKEPIILDSSVVIFLCLAGKGKIVVDMNSYQIERGSFVLLLPYSMVQVQEASKTIKVSLVSTGFDFVEKLSILQPIENYIAGIREEPLLQLTEAEMEEVIEVYNFLEKRFHKSSGPLAKEIQENILTLTALEIVNRYAVAQKGATKRALTRHQEVFRNFTLSLFKNFREHRSVQFYAQEACLSPKHFSTIIKERSGKLPSEWITQRTITLAKFLLRNTNHTIQEIANQLNFANQSFFTSYFKKATGETPTTYRNKT